MYITLLFGSLICCLPAQQPPVLHSHVRAEVTLDPPAGSISWQVSLERMGNQFEFPLHSGLTPQLDSAGSLTLVSQSRKQGGGGLDPQRPVDQKIWRITIPDGLADNLPVTISARGVIRENLEQVGSGAGRSFSATPGTIEEQGVYLAGATCWLPHPAGTLVTFSLQVDLPAGWNAVSQGRRMNEETSADRAFVRWDCDVPQEEIFLVAARFHEYTKKTPLLEALVFLRDEDPNLAARYLEATMQYVDMYAHLIGPYPYSKFALVENFWESGYGMPSFTLLGPQVIRLPFILRSSYPHEVLHNWWGNSVYVDYPSGNWCEGLTAYLADHLMKEGEGRGAEYRRDVLKKFGSYVQDGLDFPLREFRSRHSGATEAVGYGKCLILWHMIRQSVGEEAFKKGLQSFFAKFIHRRASFDDIIACIGEEAGTDLGDWARSWIEGTGAPEFRLAVEPGEELSHIVIEQVQEQDPYRVRIPVHYQLTTS
ncbi:MAG: M1 family aminopeptidase, partial [Planctomycetota bacterium]